jgi:tetratricopeptide (TPR) repeat protein
VVPTALAALPALALAIGCAAGRSPAPMASGGGNPAACSATSETGLASERPPASPAATAAAALPAEFDENVRPILEMNCRPCHFEGGKVYDRLPFDRAETIVRLGEELFTRIRDEDDRAVIRAFLARAARGPETPRKPPPALPPGAEALSLSGEPLFPAPLPDALRAEREARLAEARARAEASPDDPDVAIWLGRRLAYLGRYGEAIAEFTRGIAGHPEDPRLYRHRGHRYLTIRRFDLAIADLETAARLIAGRADEPEADGLPNARNVPTSTLHSNVWYHLGLAYYLKGDFEQALRSYREGLKVSTNPDMLCATSYWLHMTLRRLGREAEAREILEPIHTGMDVIENHDYHRLLLFYRNGADPGALLEQAGRAPDGVSLATVGYGIGNWHLCEGRRDDAVRVFREVLARSPWPAFGHVAAEAELDRLPVPEP